MRRAFLVEQKGSLFRYNANVTPLGRVGHSIASCLIVLAKKGGGLVISEGKAHQAMLIVETRNAGP